MPDTKSHVASFDPHQQVCPVCKAPALSPCTMLLCASCDHEKCWHTTTGCEEFVQAKTDSTNAVKCNCSGYVPGQVSTALSSGAIHAGRAIPYKNAAPE